MNTSDDSDNFDSECLIHFIVKTQGLMAKLGALLQNYADRKNLTTTKEIVESLKTYVLLKKLPPINTDDVIRALAANEERKIANKLGIYQQWAASLSREAATEVLQKALNHTKHSEKPDVAELDLLQRISRLKQQLNLELPTAISTHSPTLPESTNTSASPPPGRSSTKKRIHKFSIKCHLVGKAETQHSFECNSTTKKGAQEAVLGHAKHLARTTAARAKASSCRYWINDCETNQEIGTGIEKPKPSCGGKKHNRRYHLQSKKPHRRTIKSKSVSTKPSFNLSDNNFSLNQYYFGGDSPLP